MRSFLLLLFVYCYKAVFHCFLPVDSFSPSKICLPFPCCYYELYIWKSVWRKRQTTLNCERKVLSIVHTCLSCDKQGWGHQGALDDTPATVWISKVLRYLKKIEPNFFSKSVPLVNLYLIEDKWNLEDCYFCAHESTQILYLQVGFFSLSVYESRENSLWLRFILSYRNGDRIPCEFGLAQQ